MLNRLSFSISLQCYAPCTDMIGHGKFAFIFLNIDFHTVTFEVFLSLSFSWFQSGKVIFYILQQILLHTEFSCGKECSTINANATNSSLKYISWKMLKNIHFFCCTSGKWSMLNINYAKTIYQRGIKCKRTISYINVMLIQWL